MIMTKLSLTHHVNEALDLAYGDQPLFRYVYNPVMPATESPKPYFHPLYTLGGNEITCYRPHDHLWHKGLQMTMAHLSGENFWGGGSYVHGQGYVQLPNNGRMEHQAWTEMTLTDSALTLQERLAWITLAGDHWIEEVRTIGVHSIDATTGCWTLDFAMQLTNVAKQPLSFGSPTTSGRPMAGYGGLFWRGPRSFSYGSRVWADGGLEGDDIMGKAAAWLAFCGKHDGAGAQSTLLCLDHPQNVRFPNKWFMRIQPYACLSFAFMFDEKLELPAGDMLALRYRLVIGDGVLADEQIAALATQWQGTEFIP